MSTSADWTTPGAYMGRTMPVPPRRSLATTAALRVRIFLRAQLRERQRMRAHEELLRIGRYLPDNVRRDIGLPPYHP